MHEQQQAHMGIVRERLMLLLKSEVRIHVSLENYYSYRFYMDYLISSLCICQSHGACFSYIFMEEYFLGKIPIPPIRKNRHDCSRVYVFHHFFDGRHRSAR